VHGVLHGADFEPLEVLRLGDGTPVVRDVAEAVLRVGEVADAQREKLFVQFLPEFAVEGVVGGCLSLKRKGRSKT
jgi:hypothetical protein